MPELSNQQRQLKNYVEIMAWFQGDIVIEDKLTILDESIITSVLTYRGPIFYLEKPITLNPGDYEICINSADKKVTFFKIEKCEEKALVE